MEKKMKKKKKRGCREKLENLKTRERMIWHKNENGWVCVVVVVAVDFLSIGRDIFASLCVIVCYLMLISD